MSRRTAKLSLSVLIESEPRLYLFMRFFARTGMAWDHEACIARKRFA
jgi:hypothetical protein